MTFYSFFTFQNILNHIDRFKEVSRDSMTFQKALYIFKVLPQISSYVRGTKVYKNVQNWNRLAIDKFWARYPTEWKRSIFHRNFFSKHIERDLLKFGLKNILENFIGLVKRLYEILGNFKYLSRI